MLNWFALHVKSRHEFAASAELQRKGIEIFLPSVTKLRQWKDRKKLVEFPLFPGYLFVQVAPSPEDFLNVLKTKGAVKFVSLNPNNPTPVSDAEIYSLKLIIESGQEIDIYPGLKEGTRIRIKKGPLTGAEGILKRKDDQHLFLVNIDILGRSVGVKIYASELEAA